MNRRIKVTFYDWTDGQVREEVFGMLRAAELFWLAARLNPRFRVLEVWDMYQGKLIDFDARGA